MSQKSYDNSPSLYLIPTPIGNLDDITLRSINILKKVEIIFAEDTRVTRNLLNYLEINKKLISNHEHNEINNKEKLIEYLDKGFDVGLVTDRGTPVISDPGFELVREAIKNEYNVISLPGPTAMIPALIVSGIEPMPFLFYGFLNNKNEKQIKELKELKCLKYTIIFYESPHRILRTLNNMGKILGNRKISISREISKKYEQIYRGFINDIIAEMNNAKGELVVVVEGNKEEKTYKTLSVTEHVNLYIKEGHNTKTAIKMTATDRKLPKKEIYKIYHNIK